MKVKTIRRPLLKLWTVLFFVAGIFLLSFSAMGFGTARADAPSSLSPEWTIGTNLIGNADFVAPVIRNDAQSFSPTIAAEPPAENRQEWEHIDDLAGYYGALPAGMGSINTAMQSIFGAVTHMGETIEVGGMGGLTTGTVYYFSAWVRTTTPVYFDIIIGGGARVTNDLGRRFRVAPEDGWTQIGLNDAGSAFLPFRTTTNTNGFMPNS
ncbi:MAG: hypothetical protein FWC80_07300, partial [Firmicutes bacterium]|nr:hypothetical protein [Bacillota bacterium]